VAWTTIAAIYFVTWWVVLFAVLPWGERSQHEDQDEMPAGTDPGAPVVPRLAYKVIWTTVITTVLFVSIFFVFAKGWITIEQMAGWLGVPDQK
jgi:predicted secreted protein